LRNDEQDWLKTNLAKFTRMLQGQRDLLTVGRLILSELAPVVSAQQGVFYMMDGAVEEPELQLLASYAYRERKGVNTRFKLGEGLVGQAALEKERILLTRVPPDYVHISSGLGETAPMNIVVLPILFEGQVKAVMELSSLEQFSPTHHAFLDQLTESIGIVLNTIEANTRTEDLLKQSQSLASELQSRQEELQQTNQELEEKARQLFEQNEEVERKNREVEQARQALEGKAQQLSITSRYKSEFLANMSHELRTPLNSLLILAEQLSSNPDGNLSAKQVEFARTIRGSGKDLLRLINDILDLSKIESGTVTLDVGEVHFEEMRQTMERTFRHVAEGKGVNFKIDIDPSVPVGVQTDAQRLDQVLKNLLSNAFKFTERGYVNLRVAPATGGWSPENQSLNRAKNVLAFFVSDSGIGIPIEKQTTIFEPFLQADGSTSRRYGGTGLGLAISRELARVLGGEIRVESAEGRGSTFTLFLPESYSASPMDRAAARIMPSTMEQEIPAKGESAEPTPMEFTLADDRANILPGEKSVLIIEDDRDFAQWLLDLARQNGFKAVVTPRGKTALDLVREFSPAAITLDLRLPDMDGWQILNRLKSDLGTRHIPVFVISAQEEPQNVLRQGALRFLTKPIDEAQINKIFETAREMDTTKARNLLLVEDDEVQRDGIRDLIGNESARLIEASDGQTALERLRNEQVDCVVLDLMLPDMSGFELIEKIRNENEHLPIIVYTAKDLSREEEERLNRMAQMTIVKTVRSPERLFDQTALWLHRDVATLPEDKRELLRRLNDPNEILAGKKVVIVDDDIRNIFAMTSMLERYKMDVHSAETGKAALELLKKEVETDLVLMDIMLPEMDGYETIRAVRKMYGFEQLPIIALTAKAMKGDREKCIDAGASDYISKPVDTERLLTLLRNWLHR
jgi:CheY-like chemotaxis protein/GAF domain-containing protein